MARKANIAREEIHQACWELIEKNSFPNIPRLTEYFIHKDGRRCSNTTFLNAITEWEEVYKEQQQHQLSELNDVLLPVFKRFSREVTESLGKLLDEKANDLEYHQLRKQEATENGYLSLSTTLIELQNSYDQLVLEHKQILNEAELVKQKHEYSEQRYQQVLTQNAVLTNQIKQEQQHNTECRINLAQKEVDLAKQDNQILMLEEQNAKLVKQVEELQRQKAQAEAKSWQKMAEKLDSLSSSLKSLSAKDRGSKQ